MSLLTGSCSEIKLPIEQMTAFLVSFQKLSVCSCDNLIKGVLTSFNKPWIVLQKASQFYGCVNSPMS